MGKVFDQIEACLNQTYKWRGWDEHDRKIILDLAAQIRVLARRYDKRLAALRKMENNK